MVWPKRSGLGLPSVLLIRKAPRKVPEMTNLQQETAPSQGEHTAPVEAWDAIAALYDEHVAPGEADLATAGLRLAGLQAGDTFLDVAAGPGGLSLPAARLGANVLATDWSVA